MKRILAIVVLLAAIGIGAGFYLYNKPHKNMNRQKASFTLEAPELFTEYQGDETAANEKYLDEVVQVSGVVKSISQSEDGTTSVILETGDDFAGVICQLDPLTEHKRTQFQKGEQVSFKGICTGLLMDVVLVRCVEA